MVSENSASPPNKRSGKAGFTLYTGFLTCCCIAWFVWHSPASTYYQAKRDAVELARKLLKERQYADEVPSALIIAGEVPQAESLMREALRIASDYGIWVESIDSRRLLEVTAKLPSPHGRELLLNALDCVTDAEGHDKEEILRNVTLVANNLKNPNDTEIVLNKAIQIALQMKAKQAPALFQIADAYLSRKSYDRAKQLLNQAVATTLPHAFTSDLLLPIRYARAFYEAQAPHRAKEFLDIAKKALDVSDFHADTHTLMDMTQLYFDLHDTLNAKSMLERALRFNKKHASNDFPNFKTLKLLFMLKGVSAVAEEVGQSESLVQYALEVARKYATPDIQLQLIERFVQASARWEPEKHAQCLPVLAGGYLALSYPQKAAEMLNQALQLMDGHSFLVKASDFKEVVDVAMRLPDRNTTHLLLSRTYALYRESGHIDYGREGLKKALVSGFLQFKEPQVASKIYIRELHRAEKDLSSTSAEGWLEFAEIAIMLADNVEAHNALLKAIAQNQKNPLMENLPLWKVIQVAMQITDTRLVTELLEKELSILPLTSTYDRADAFAEIVEIYIKLGNITRAYEIAWDKRLNEKERATVLSRVVIAWACYKDPVLAKQVQDDEARQLTRLIRGME